jgi:PAS domain S-box-containing protein
MNGLKMNDFFSDLDRVPMGALLLDEHLRLLRMNTYAKQLFGNDQKTWWDPVWQQIFLGWMGPQKGITREETTYFTYHERFFMAYQFIYPLASGNGTCVLFYPCAKLARMLQELSFYKDVSLDLEAIFDSSHDVLIYVSDGQGKTLHVSSACLSLWGYSEEELVGSTVYELERQGVFTPSITRLVLEKREKVQGIQTTRTGRRLLVSGSPYKDEQGNIVRVVNFSKDITEISQLQSELELMKNLTEGYRREVMDLRMKHEVDSRLVYRSERMENVVDLARRFAKFETPLLLLGESGVGKALFASYIHKESLRKEKPFILVNCAAVPETLMEMELFGSKEEAKEPKLGALEMANGGTLFLEEVDALSLGVQFKLLRVIEDQKMQRVGSRETFPVDIRVIASTSRDLEELIRRQMFSKDFYYHLNGVPIVIPPLRERKEDIIKLILYFTERLNRKYQLQKKFHPLLLKQLQDYDWPGNVRELQHVTERLIVTSEDPLIGPEDLPEAVTQKIEKQRPLEVHKIIPLKEAIAQLEKELLELSYEKYKSTTKMAEVLGVNQSTISRKWNKLKGK